MDGVGIAAGSEALAALDPLGGHPRAHHHRDVVLAGDDRTVDQRAADVGDKSFRLGKQRCPGRRGGWADEDVSGAIFSKSSVSG